MMCAMTEKQCTLVTRTWLLAGWLMRWPAGVQRALAAQQLVQQQRQQQQGSASMGPPEQQASAASHAALPQPSRAAPGLPLSANWVCPC